MLAADRICGAGDVVCQDCDWRERHHLKPTSPSELCCVVAAEVERQERIKGCAMCMRIEKDDRGFGPSHDGSLRCESGSLSSGGRNAHCSCDTCF